MCFKMNELPIIRFLCLQTDIRERRFLQNGVFWDVKYYHSPDISHKQLAMFASLQFQETLHRHTNLITSNSFTRLTPNLHLWTTTVSLAIVSPNMLKKFKSIKFVSSFVFYNLNWKSQKLLLAGINYLFLQNRNYQKPKYKNL